MCSPRTLLALTALLAAAAAVTAGEAGTNESDVIVATNIAGTVSITSASGAERSVVSTQVLHSGDIVATGDSSLAIIDLADVGKVTLGPTTTATTFSRGGDLSLQLTSGMLCVQAENPGVNVSAGAVNIAALDKRTMFDVKADGAATKVAVYRGVVNVVGPDRPPNTLRAGAAASGDPGDVLHAVPFASLSPEFTPLSCPAMPPSP